MGAGQSQVVHPQRHSGPGGVDKVGRRALGRTDWAHAGRMWPGQAAAIVPALLHLPVQGLLAVLPHVPGHLQNRPDKTFVKQSCLKESGE